MTEYVLGFYIYNDHGNNRYVILIRKQRPEWQKGLLNGVGGHLEQGETPEQGMAREFKEETGVETHPESWKRVALMTGNDWMVHVFTMETTNRPNFRSLTDEQVVAVTVRSVMRHPQPHPTIENIPWLLKMIESQWKDGVSYYNVEYVR